MGQLITVELPTEEWQKMERHHEILEEFEFNVDIFGYDKAQTMLHIELKNLQEESKN